MYLLTQTNVNLNLKGEYGHTLLHTACSNINNLPLQIFKLLIETLGCDVNVQNNDENTPLHRAVDCFDPNDGGDITVLTYLLTQKGVNVNLKDGYGYTLLHWACQYINKLPLGIFQYLIETKGCDVNAQDDDDNDTPLHNALRYFDPNKGGDMTVLMYLLGHENVNVNIKGLCGSTLLHYVCATINQFPLDVLKFLIETQGFDVNAQDNNKNTPLHCALRNFYPNNSRDITAFTHLINQMNINVNIKDRCGLTLLQLACIHKIGYDDDDDDGDDHSSDEGLDDSVIRDIQNQKADTNLCQIVEAIAERCVQQVLDETNLK
jgi:ankyrin repeat protein